MDYLRWRRYAWPFFAFASVVFYAPRFVLFLDGEFADSWRSVVLGIYASFQPTEVVVLAAILFLAQALDLNRTAKRPFDESVAGFVPLRLKKLAHVLREPLFALGMTAFLLFAQQRVGAPLVLMLTQSVVMVAGRFDGGSLLPSTSQRSALV